MEEAVKLIMEIANIDSRDIAEYYLSVSNGDVQMAIGMLLEDGGGGTSSQMSGNMDSKDCIVIEDSPPTNSILTEQNDAKACISIDNSPPEITVLEWNIQGLLGDFLNERTIAIVNIIKQHNPTVIMFQEVILETYLYFKSALKPNYLGFSPAECGTSCMGYFTAIFTDKRYFKSPISRVIPFSRSKQGRDLLIVEGMCHDHNVVALTSHLESQKSGETERKRQLAILYSSMTKIPQNRTVIFGGDTNLRDAEFNSMVHSQQFDTNKVNDVWNMLGSPQDTRYSWDLQKNDNQIKGGQARLRFERLYTRCESIESKQHFKPKDLKFVGTERLQCGLFPSDHWGMLATFFI